MRIQEIRDPVHNFIYVNDLELRIIGTPPFQRLRYIRQLAMTYLVFPGAEHSRFAHSMGVMEFATRIFDTLIEKHRKELKWTEQRRKRNRQLLRLAALLHDLGHPPFSHASEDLVPGGDHEQFSRKFIESEWIAPEIDKFKPELDITAGNVAEFFSKENIDPDVAFLKQIFSGEIDADKCDYLYRDSLFTGVHYGKFDYQRLIQSLCLIRSERTGNFDIAVEHGGLHALEAMVLARYFMFTQVYFHKTRRAYDHHLADFLLRHHGKYPSELKQYIKRDDTFVLSLLKKHPRDVAARAILAREPYVQAFTTQEHINDEERTRFAWLERELEEKHTNRFFVDAAEKSPHKFQQAEVTVMDATTGKPTLVTNLSGIIRNLQKIEQYRIFTAKKDQQEINNFCTAFWSSHAN